MSRLAFSNCPICDSNNLKPYLEVKDHSISKEVFSLKQCTQCSFVFTSNPPVESQAGSYYKSEQYISHSNTSKGAINKLYKIARGLMLSVKKGIVAQYSSGKKLLDYGTGTGFFMQYMKAKGYAVRGVELDDDARNFGIQTHGLNIGTPEELLHSEEEKILDAITLWHVLEHLYDPKKYLQKFHELLSDQGTLFLALPNYDCLDGKVYASHWAGYDLPRHLWHFNPKTVREIAVRTGFKVVALKRLPFDPMYIAMLSAKYKGQFLSFIVGAVVGLISLLNSFLNIEKSSSIVYVLKKKS